MLAEQLTDLPPDRLGLIGSWVVGGLDRLGTVGVDGGGIDVPGAWKLGRDPVLGAASARDFR